MQASKPKFEKVDDNTIRIKVELLKTDDVALIELVKNRETMVKQKEKMIAETEQNCANIDANIKSIDTILEEAKKLGIVAKEPEKPKAPVIRKLKEGEESKGCLKEGTMKKGGVNTKPSTPRPDAPKGQAK